MLSLQSYRQSEPVYDNKAYTITSTYIGGQLKMYTCHPGQPGGPGSRPEYYMTQLKSSAMTDTIKTFRKGATAYRNARAWAEKKRNEAIRRANERANDSQATAPALGASFASEDSLDDPYTLSQQSQISLNKDSNTTAKPRVRDFSG
jgi:hypothetical protein